ncbi:hypothetical protein FTW19_08195 [Terriglobus albidus]|uniref:Uncharacterized protein n=1 Tax=Terriglobus albidus TaxID=1592106 RepID=A0A5B9ECD8_9BACT|nr:hypothetical protein [Terriglobus albidus]QEE27977.1 hypothetical protein FTW19_08195 [Terriglobus albidus]
MREITVSFFSPAGSEFTKTKTFDATQIGCIPLVGDHIASTEEREEIWLVKKRFFHFYTEEEVGIDLHCERI